MKRRLKLFLAPLILLATIAVIARYLAAHSYLLRRLAHTPFSTVVWVLFIDVLAFGTLILVLTATTEMYKKRLSWRDNFLLSAYSSLVNFFGPGQSGPAVRAAYLKKRLNMKIKQYTFATLIYYACFAVLSAFLVMAGQAEWWETILAVAAVGLLSFVVIKRFIQKRMNDEANKVHFASIGVLVVATALQMLTQIALYAVELHSVDKHVAFGQILTYTGVANFAVFVALTPGAIGIRESFLVFSEKLHHISSASIVSANLIDRGVYILFLGVLFLFVIGLHAKERVVGKTKSTEKKAS